MKIQTWRCARQERRCFFPDGTEISRGDSDVTVQERCFFPDSREGPDVKVQERRCFFPESREGPDVKVNAFLSRRIRLPQPGRNWGRHPAGERGGVKVRRERTRPELRYLSSRKSREGPDVKVKAFLSRRIRLPQPGRNWGRHPAGERGGVKVRYERTRPELRQTPRWGKGKRKAWRSRRDGLQTLSSVVALGTENPFFHSSNSVEGFPSSIWRNIKAARFKYFLAKVSYILFKVSRILFSNSLLIL